MSDAFMAAAQQMANIALASDQTSAVRHVFVGLLTLSRDDCSESAAFKIVESLVEEGGKRRFGSYPCLFLPHAAVTILDDLRQHMGLPKMRAPGVVPGTWQHEGIEFKKVIHVGLDEGLDFARRDTDGRGRRQVRCMVTEFTSDTTGTLPYVRVADLDRQDEGSHLIQVAEFLEAMDRATPTPGSSGPKR